MKTNEKKELDLIDLGVLTAKEPQIGDQLEKALVYYWLNEIKPEWKSLTDIQLDLSEFEDWI